MGIYYFLNTNRCHLTLIHLGVDLLRGVTIYNIARAAFYYLINLIEVKEKEKISNTYLVFSQSP